MTEKRARTGYPSLVVAICGFVALGGVIAVLSAWSFVGQRLKESRDAALAEAVSVRARGVGLDFARELHQDWRNLRLVAVEMTGRGEPAVRTALDLIVAEKERISWAGLASVDGKVLTASSGMLEGPMFPRAPGSRTALAEISPGMFIRPFFWRSCCHPLETSLAAFSIWLRL